MEPAVQEGNMSFALRLSNILSDGTQNLFFSPYSISSVLSMLHLGAKGETEKELKKELGLEEICDKSLHSALSAILKSVRNDKGGVTLESANKLFPELSFELLKEFVDHCKKFYKTEVEGLNFAQNPEESRKQINDWATSQTQGKITDVLPPGSIDNLTKLVLVNAVYFKGDWKEKFQAEMTTKSPFHMPGNRTVNVDMMSRKGKYKMAYDEKLKTQVLELPYKGGEVSMLILLPAHITGLSELAKQLTPDSLMGVMSNFHEETVQLQMPKILMEQQLELGDFLQKMGITKIFSEAANLKGISSLEGIYVSKVVHKAFIEVNEEGSEAAAVTAAVIGVNSLAPRPLIFNCNHPFMFLIMHNRTKTILFCGYYASPK